MDKQASQGRYTGRASDSQALKTMTHLVFDCLTCLVIQVNRHYGRGSTSLIANRNKEKRLLGTKSSTDQMKNAPKRLITMAKEET